MCRRNQIIFCSFLILGSLFARADVQGFATRADYDKIYQSIVSKVKSNASIEDKVGFIKSKNAEYVALAKKMMQASDTNPEILKDATYSYLWDLYDKIIPLLKIKANPETQKAVDTSCLEASRLVQPAPSEKAEELGLGGIAIDDAGTAELLSILCQ